MIANPIRGAPDRASSCAASKLIVGSVLFHLGVLMIFAGHVVGLLTPIAVFDALGISHGAKQLLAIVAGGFAGVLGITGATLLIHRRFFDPRVRAASSFADNMIILLLWAQLALGLATIPLSLQHLDGHEMVKFMTWAQGIFTFRSGRGRPDPRCGAGVQAAPVHGTDDPAAVPLHPAGPHAERAGALCLALGLSGGTFEEDGAMNFEPVLVGGREIPAEAIAAEAQHHPAPDAAAAWNAAAEALAVRQLLLGEAERLGLVPGDRRDADGRPLTEEDARIDALLEQEVRVPEADEAACRRFYDHNRDRFASPVLVEAAHILIEADPADEFAMGLATGDARTLIRQLQAEHDRFAEVARVRSACPSGQQGGNLGQVGPGMMVKPFEEALFALPENSLCTQPVKTRFGVHVIRSGRRAEARQLPFEAVREAIAGYLEEASYRRAVAQYIAILAGQAGVSGVAIAGAEGAMVQ
jgi:peptidyl-prolyl cis-trans isomerase C